MNKPSASFTALNLLAAVTTAVATVYFMATSLVA